MGREPDKWRTMKNLPLAEVFNQSKRLKRMGVLEQSRQLDIYTRWHELVGADVAKHSRPVKFRQGNLTVAVSSPTWMQQLTMLKPTLLKTLQDALGPALVKDIQLTTRDFGAGQS